MPAIQIDLPATTVTLDLGRQAQFGTIIVDLDRMPPNSLSYIFAYGLKQVINDKIATKTDKDGNDLSEEAIRDKAVAKREALYNGTLRTRNVGVAVDEYEVEAFKEMKRHLIAQLTKANLMGDIPKKTQNRFLYAVNRMLAKAGKPEMTERDYLIDRLINTPGGRIIRDRARETVDARHAMEEDVIDLLEGDDEDSDEQETN